MVGNNSTLNKTIEEAISVWRKDGQDPFNNDSEFFSINKDPVVQLLMGAVAHQGGLIGDSIDRLRDDIVERYLELATPDGVNRATPSVALMQIAKNVRVGASNIEPTYLDENVSFKVGKNNAQSDGYTFLPLFRTRVVDAEVVSVSERGNGIWHIEISVNEPIDSLDCISFFLKNTNGSDRVRLFSDGREIPLCQLHQFDRLPFIQSFMGMSGNGSCAAQFQILNNILDALCLLDATYVIVEPGSEACRIQLANGCIQLDMEIANVDEHFVLKTEDVLLNCVPVANISIEKVSLSPEQPFYKIDTSKSWFLSLIAQEETPQVQVRSVGTERQTAASWSSQLRHLLEQYEQNYNIYKSQLDTRLDATVRQFVTILRDVTDNNPHADKSIYLVLSDRTLSSAEASFMSTQGGGANGIDFSSKIEVQTAEIDANRCHVVVSSRGGRDEADLVSEIHKNERFFVTTLDRIVSKADIKSFCVHALSSLFDLKGNNIYHVTITPIVENTGMGFFERVMLIEITVSSVDIDFEYLSRVLERMLRYRTATLTPIRVSVIPQ